MFNRLVQARRGQKSKEHAPCRAVAVKDPGKVTEINGNLHRDLFGDLSPFQQRTQTWFFVEKVAKGPDLHLEPCGDRRVT